MTEKGYYGVTRSSDYLSHHGILGQKWGIRRFQNKDGSLTEAGKKRYSQKDVEDAFVASMRAHSDALAKVAEGNERIPKMANELSQEYKREFNTMSFTKADKKRIYDQINSDYGGYLDRDLFDNALYDAVTSRISAKVDAKLKPKLDAFKKAQDEYWDSAQAITKDVMQKYGEVDVGTGWADKRKGKFVINELVAEHLNTGRTAYIWNHFEDYMVYELDAHYDAVDRLSKNFSYNEYLRLLSQS